MSYYNMIRLKELNNKLDEKNNDKLTDNERSLMKRIIDDLHIELNQKSTEIQNLMKRIDNLNIESNQKSTEINNLTRFVYELKNLVPGMQATIPLQKNS